MTSVPISPPSAQCSPEGTPRAPRLPLLFSSLPNSPFQSPDGSISPSPPPRATPEPDNANDSPDPLLINSADIPTQISPSQLPRPSNVPDTQLSISSGTRTRVSWTLEMEGFFWTKYLSLYRAGLVGKAAAKKVKEESMKKLYFDLVADHPTLPWWATEKAALRAFKDKLKAASARWAEWEWANHKSGLERDEATGLYVCGDKEWEQMTGGDKHKDWLRKTPLQFVDVLAEVFNQETGTGEDIRLPTELLSGPLALCSLRASATRAREQFEVVQAARREGKKTKAARKKTPSRKRSRPATTPSQGDAFPEWDTESELEELDDDEVTEVSISSARIKRPKRQQSHSSDEEGKLTGMLTALTRHIINSEKAAASPSSSAPATPLSAASQLLYTKPWATWLSKPQKRHLLLFFGEKANYADAFARAGTTEERAGIVEVAMMNSEWEDWSAGQEDDE